MHHNPYFAVNIIVSVLVNLAYAVINKESSAVLDSSGSLCCKDRFLPSHKEHVSAYAFYVFYVWWFHFLLSGALAEGTSLPMSHKHDQA